MSYDDSYYGDGEYAGESIDTDGDGLSDESESFYGTNPTLSDTDGDGYDDLTEIVNGYNPNGPGAMDESMNYDY
ncbi:calcium-binding protein [Candidatus Uhrbacteria bacterium]|nr:calcium-binding protein [Candidatus Uhrbacteria bacterium]